MIRFALGALAGFIVALSVSSISADKDGGYIGLEIGRSHAALPVASEECANCSEHRVQTRSDVLGAFTGYRRSSLALELGAGELSKYRSHNVRPSVPADIRQEIDTTQVYLRALAYAPKVIGLEPFGSVGVARVSMNKHEWGYNDQSRKRVDQMNCDTRVRPMYAVGFDASIAGNTSVRLEVTHIRHVAVSHWTLEQNVTVGWAGVMVRFL